MYFLFILNKYSYIVIFLLLAAGGRNHANGQQVRHTYRFYNNLSTTEPDCAPDLQPAKTLNTFCLTNAAATPGNFMEDVVPAGGISRNVYHNFPGWGLKYLNTTGVINQSYTVQLYVKVTNFNQFWTRLIDFSNGIDDNGIYFTNTSTPTTGQCLNFYPNGNFGICPFFNDSTYYFLTITRNAITKLIDIYVNAQLFTSYNDASDFYVSTAGKPVFLFRDDPVGYSCEDGQANFAYVSFANYYSTNIDVSLIYQQINAIANTADFSVTPASTCAGGTVTVNYSGNISPYSTQYVFNWDWNGGTVISGSGRGPYTVSWDTAGIKTITLSIGGGCSSSLINYKNIIITPAISTQIDTTICPGNSYAGHSIAGTYSDTFSTAGGCDSIRLLHLMVEPLTVPNLGNVRGFCKGDSILLSPGNFDNYMWQDGSTQKTYMVKKPGLYSVTVSTKCTTAIARVVINEENCDIFFPNAFSPNKDGKNELFKVLGFPVFSEYTLAVYNRYGQIVFKTNNPDIGWDGTFNGKDSEIGVYVWKCTARRTNSEPLQFLKGNVMIIR